MTQFRISLPDGQIITHDLHDERITIGRLEDNNLQIGDDSISSHHAELIADGGSYRLKDLGSTNGTFVNGSPVTDVLLNPGDSIRFGQVDVEFITEGEGGSRPLPQMERTEFAVGSSSGRPASFVSASPFPKPAEGSSPIALAAVVIALLGAVAFGVAMFLTATMAVPV